MKPIKRKWIVAVAVAITLSPMARAQAPAKPTPEEISKVLSSLYGYRASYGECADSDGGAGSIRCINDELAFQDGRLNRAYRALSAKLSPDLKEKLKASEKLWMQFRDSTCAAIVDGLDRPRIDELGCRLEETAKQATDLEARLFLQD